MAAPPKTAIAPSITSAPGPPAFRLGRTRLSQVWAVTAVVVPVLVIAGSPLVATDLTYHLRAGEMMLDTHAILRTDVFSIAAYGTPWLNQQWLCQVFLAAAFRLGGWFALVALRTLLTALVLTFVFLACRASGAPTKRAAWLTLATGLLLPAGFILRPQLLGMVCFASTAWLVARRHEHPRAVWVVIPVTALWANVHGTFFLGVLLLALAWVEDRWLHRRAAPVLLAGVGSVLATLVNPYGYRVWAYAVDVATNPVIRGMVTEWRPPSVEDYTGAVFFVSLVGVATLLIARVRRPVPWASLLPLAVFMAIALMAVRGVCWWAIVAPIVLAGALSEHAAPTRRRDPDGPVNAAIVGLLGLTLVAILLRWVPYTGRPMPDGGRLTLAPAGITRQLHRVLPPGELVFNAQQWGSWLEFEFPENRVIVDSRIEVVPQSVWSKYMDVSAAVEGWQATIDTFNVSVAVLGRDYQPNLIRRMKVDAGWRLIYEDADGAIFVRT